MGLPDGHSVLLYYQARGTRYQVILLSMSALPRRKAKQDNAMWRHVWPKFTTFAWLSQCTAEAFNMEALARDHTREYGNFAEPHLGLEQDFAAPIHIEDVFYLGETRSIEDLTVLTRMPAERLCLGLVNEPIFFRQPTGSSVFCLMIEGLNSLQKKLTCRPSSGRLPDVRMDI